MTTTTLLTGEVTPGRIVKLCQQKSGRNKCGRKARVYSNVRKLMLCDRCVAETDTDTQPIPDDGRRFVPAAVAPRETRDINALVRDTIAANKTGGAA